MDACNHDYQEFTIRIGAGISSVVRACLECDFVLSSADVRNHDTLVRRATIGQNEWRVTIERVVE